jgi:predicted NBD/HSP70 family sugar kinase
MTSHSAEERLLDLLSHSAGLTRAQLSRRLSLSKATVSGLVADLLARDVLTEERADGVAAAGRPGTVVRLVGPNRAFALFQWSGRRLRATLADFAGRTLADRAFTVPEQTLDQLVAGVAAELTSLHRMADRDPHLTVGLVAALPTPFQPGVGIPPPGRSARASSPEESPMWAHAGWLSTDPVPALGARLGIPVHAENDANLAALGEVAAGAAREQDTVAFIKLTANTIGMGLVLSGRIHRGASGFAGELAHIQVDPNGPLCYCGGRGCLRGLLGDALLDAVRPAYDKTLEFEDVLELAGAGEPGPRRILDDLGRTLGRALADFCTLLNPSAIVIDGGLGDAGQVVVRAVEESIDRHSAPHAALAVRVLGGSLGADAELAGARALLAATAQLPTR